MTAILGASGAGKTTTLDIIAGFEKLGKVRGKILLNGAPLPDSYRYLVGYVLQEDKAIGTLTVQEHLMYTALMRLPGPFRNSRVYTFLVFLGFLVFFLFFFFFWC